MRTLSTGRLRLLGAALVAVVVLAVAGCSADAGTDAGGAALPDGVEVEVVQLRADVSTRTAQVAVHNGSDETLVIGEVRVSDRRFASDAVRDTERESRVAAGMTVNVRVELPEVACPAPDDAEPRVTLAFTREDATTGEATVPASDPLGFIAPLNERECRAREVADAAAIAFERFTPSPPGQPARLDLAIEPAGGSGLSIEGVQETNLLSFGTATVDGAYPVGLDVSTGGADRTVISLPIVPFRCDPHAVQEDKRGTIFDVRVVLNGEPGEIEVFVGEDMRGKILSWVADWCGFGPGA
ncbi:hypothetical protein [Microbacterium immunditiarum]|uniref:Lipoprotein n=1 Tax=Microbacterium immunditiarum TaxID=337480 RepID=A0A7Y9KHZ3_9MICO|nr:hypothetical protein [Microbacterium immunditiarum]NYE18205.1 hypothetical protein [Microbacterium immunditiarum]